MRLLTILILTAILTAQTYIITVEIEVESLQKAGEVERVVLERLKDYKPEIGIKTKVDVQRLFYGAIVDSLKPYQGFRNYTLEIQPNDKE